jgi:hypothetical protein
MVLSIAKLCRITEDFPPPGGVFSARQASISQTLTKSRAEGNHQAFFYIRVTGTDLRGNHEVIDFNGVLEFFILWWRKLLPWVKRYQCGNFAHFMKNK